MVDMAQHLLDIGIKRRPAPRMGDDVPSCEMGRR
jgi:hypothetical protein